MDDERKTEDNSATVKIPIEVSARHVHLSQSDLEVLFGKDFQLDKVRNLSQPSEFLSTSRLTIMGERGKIDNVAVLGPLRKNSQVEISLTDARNLGLTPPIRLSGDLENSGTCKLVGPVGELELESGVIIARRHLHINPSQAKKLGIENGDFISVETKKCLRPIIFKDVLVRVGDNFNLSMHIDTDEGNAASLTPDSYGEKIDI